MTNNSEAPLEGQPSPAVVTQAELEYGLAMAADKGDARACQDFITMLGDKAGAETVRGCLRIGMSQALEKGRGRDVKVFVQLLGGWAETVD